MVWTGEYISTMEREEQIFIEHGRILPCDRLEHFQQLKKGLILLAIPSLKKYSIGNRNVCPMYKNCMT
jgi:hypothetical protein